MTGVGVVSPVGTTADRTWEALLAGRSGVAPIEAPWAAALPVAIAARVDDGFADGLDATQRRRLDRNQQLALVAGREAWAQSGAAGTDPDRVGVVVGSAIGGLETTLAQRARLAERGPRLVSPHTVTMMMANGAAGWLSLDIGARAGARTPVSACASGSEALLMGREMILAGSADVVLCGGTEACVTDLTLAALASARALSRRTDDPSRASRPFDADRDGFVLGEGAALVVLESEEHARARGATVLATLAGAAVTSDAHDIVNGDPTNPARTVSLALRSAGLAPTDVGLVVAHATSTPAGDANEARAVAAAVGPVPTTSPKSMVGHLLGGSGSLSTVVAALALRDGEVPPTTGVTTVDPEVALDVVTTRRTTPDGAVLVNAFGFGGQNCAAVVSAV